MLCLHDSIRYDDPSVQRLLGVVEDAQTLTALMLAAWSLARVLAIHIVEAVLAQRALSPTSWPRCPQCGVFFRSHGFVKRQVTSLVGPIQWRLRVGRCPQGCGTPYVAPLDEVLGLGPISAPAGNSSTSGVHWRFLCRLPPRPSALAGTAVGPSVRQRCGDGCKRPVNGRWRRFRSTYKLWRKATCRRQRRCRPTWHWPLASWVPMESWSHFDPREASPQGRRDGTKSKWACWPAGPASHAYR